MTEDLLDIELSIVLPCLDEAELLLLASLRPARSWKNTQFMVR